ncbi:MAG: YARHG domain-containing protein [Lachnospiraceae bacterium]
MKCNNCNAEVKEGSKFCTKCGTKIEFPATETSLKSIEVEDYNMKTVPLKDLEIGNRNEISRDEINRNEIPENKPVQSGAAKKGNGVGLIIAAVIVVVLLVVVIAVLSLKIFVLNNDKKKDSEDVTTEVTTENDTTTESLKVAEEPSLFESMPTNFVFASGAGGWDTTIDINPDGTFTGVYHDSDMGSSGEGYDATVYICSFEGKFTTPVKVTDYSYTTTLEYLNVDDETKEEIIDRVKYIPAFPYGLEDGGQFMIYLPGAKVSDLPESFIAWTMGMRGDGNSDTINYYGIYNVNTEEAFFDCNYDSEPEYPEYIIADSDVRLLTDDDVAGLSVQQINYAKNEIYARHGYIFESPELQEYFGNQPWYEPRYERAEFDRLGLLSDVENKNASFLSGKEKSLGGYELDK